jgi:hypothetical protein
VRTALVSDGDHYRRRLSALIARSTIVKASEFDLAWLYLGMGYEAAADDGPPLKGLVVICSFVESFAGRQARCGVL